MQISTQTYFASFFEAKYWTNYVCIFIKKKNMHISTQTYLAFFWRQNIGPSMCVSL